MSTSIHILLLLLTVPFIYTTENNEKTLSDCRDGKCFINNGAESSCVQLSTSSYKDLKKEITTRFNELGISDISQVHCNTTYEQCLDLAPTSGHKKKCTDFTIEESDEKCCYMKVEYEGNSKYSCYPARKDKKEIDSIIKVLKKEYIGSEKISIDCSGKFVSLSVALFFCLLL